MDCFVKIPGFCDYRINKSGEVISYKANSPHPMRPTKSKNGYLKLELCNSEGCFTRSIHCLVILAFRGPPPSDKTQVNHKNGVKDDNRLENLEYVTPSQNAKHAIKLGLLVPITPPSRSGKNHSQSPENRKRAIQIYKTKYQLRSAEEVGKEFGVAATTVRSIWARRVWKSIHPVV